MLISCQSEIAIYNELLEDRSFLFNAKISLNVVFCDSLLMIYNKPQDFSISSSRLSSRMTSGY